MGNAKISAQDGLGYGVPVARVVTAPVTRLDYEVAKNKPSINGKTLEGELSLADIGITPEQIGGMTRGEVEKLVSDALKQLGLATDQDIEDLFGKTEEPTPTPEPEPSTGDDDGPEMATDQDISDLFG